VTRPSLREVWALIQRLEDLKRQATIERSHFYVDATLTEAIAMLYALTRQVFGETAP